MALFRHYCVWKWLKSRDKSGLITFFAMSDMELASNVLFLLVGKQTISDYRARVCAKDAAALRKDFSSAVRIHAGVSCR